MGDTNSKQIPLVKIVGCGCWKINRYKNFMRM